MRDRYIFNLNSDTAYAQATARSKSGTVINLNLIARFEKKIQATLARIWGEPETA